MEDLATRTEQIARLNDKARLGKDRTAKFVMTRNLQAALDNGTPAGAFLASHKVLQAIKDCSFSDDSPERDLAFFDIDGHKSILKIDYYDTTLKWGSEDPANSDITRRVVTVMLVEDY